MALVVADRVQETTTTTGTGTYTLAGAKDGFQSFAAVGNGNTTYYACTDGTDYEVGIGTYTLSGTTLARTTIIESSNSDAAVNWGAGEKDIFVTLPASKATVLDASGNATFTGDVTFSGNNHSGVTWDTSEDEFLFSEGSRIDFGGGANIRRESDGILQITGATADDTYFNFSNNLIFYRGGSAAAQLMYSDGSQRFHAYGNITVGGTVDGVDIATRDAVLTSTTTTADGALQRSGGTVTGGVTFQSTINFLDNKQIRMGSGNDFRLQHNGVNSYIDNYQNDLYIRNLADDKDVYIQSDDGAGGLANYFFADGSTGEAQLFHYGSEKLATKSTGIDVTGTVTDDGATHDGDVTFTGANYNVVWDKSDDQFEFASNAKVKFGSFSELYDNGAATLMVDVTPIMKLNYNTGGTGGPSFSINHDSTSAADGDTSGNIYFSLNDVQTAFITSTQPDVTTSTSSGDLIFKVRQDNSMVTYMTIDGEGEDITMAKPLAVTGDITASGKIGLDSTDYITFTGNTQMDVYINGSNEFRFEADGDFHADGNVIAYSTTVASDAALKENIKPVTGLASVMALDGVSFDWKRDGKKSAGVIAQQVQKIMPEAVTEVKAMNGSKHLSVNYNALTSVLIEAIKDLKAEIEELKNGSHN